MKPDKPYDLPVGSKFTPIVELKLRDYFAAAALQGMLATGPMVESWIPEGARLAYELADAMLAERQRNV